MPKLVRVKTEAWVWVPDGAQVRRTHIHIGGVEYIAQPLLVSPDRSAHIDGVVDGTIECSFTEE